MGLTKRDFAKSIAIGVGAATLPAGGFLARPARAQTALTGITYLPPSYKALTWGMAGFVERAQQNGGEALEVQFYDSGTLVAADEQTAALRAGTVDFMFHTSSYITRSFEILGITGLPSLVEELWEHGDRLKMETPLWQLINQELAKENIFMLSAGGGVFEPEYIWSGGDRIGSLDDLQGKRARVVSYEASTALEKFGVAPVRVSSAETYLALQRGTVDAVVANISTVIGRNLHEQLQHVYRLPVTAFSISIYLLKDQWDQLEEPTRQALWDAARWYDDNSVRYAKEEVYPNEYWPTVEEAGIEVIEPQPEDVETFAQASQEVWTWWKDQVGEEVGQRAIDLALGRTA